MSGRALSGLQGLKGVIKTGMQVGGNVASGIVNSLIDTGSIDPLGMALDIGLGMLQGSVGSGVTNSILGKLGLTECGIPKRLWKLL